MAIVKLWTATGNSNPTRFDGEGLIWASPAGVHYTGYGQYVWELEVELPLETQGVYIRSHYQVPPTDWEWGMIIGDEHHPRGAYAFYASAIRGARLLSEKEIKGTSPPEDEYIYGWEYYDF